MINWLLALTATFMIQIGNIYIANIVFVLWTIIRFFAGHRNYRFDKTSLYIFLFYIGWVLASMMVFAVQYGYFSIRNLIQFAFNIQYLILMVYGSIDKTKLRHAMHICSYILAFTIIGLWVVKMKMMNIPTLIVSYREWAADYLGGFPNSTILPLAFGVFVETRAIFRERKIIGIIRLGVLLFAILLCGSRSGYVGAAFVIIYFLFTEREGTKLWWRILKYSASIVMAAIIVVSVISTIAANDLGGRMFMVSDRYGIIIDAFNYFRNRPLTGYGGNTIDVIYEVVGKTATGHNWGHTHNTVLELLVRHGFIGALSFFLLIFHISKRIVSKEDKAMYWILWTLSLFQIYYKDFIFLLLLYMLIPSRREQSNPVIYHEKLVNVSNV